MFSIPTEITATVDELNAHYTDFVSNDRGANGYLWFAQNRISRAEVAIKFYSGESGDRRHDEPRQLSAISSPNVLPILDARNVSDDWAYFITPRCNEGDLDDLIATRPCVHVAIDVALGICNGVSALHAQRMVHRDLKPGNIVLDRGTPRIADFGSVRTLNANETNTSASQHSVLYRPPESFATNRYSRRGDVYQLGLVTYQLLGGVLHYDGTQYLSTRDRRKYEKITDIIDRSLFVDSVIQQRAEAGTLIDLTSLPPWVSSGAKRGIRAITHPTPSRRLGSMSDVAAQISQLRITLRNWQWVGATARLVSDDRVIELRPTHGNRYEAFQQKQSSFRRVSGLEPSALSDLVTYYSR